jgi:hypothetical protein
VRQGTAKWTLRVPEDFRVAVMQKLEQAWNYDKFHNYAAINSAVIKVR